MAAKDSGLRIRVERPLRTAFLEACREQDKPAAQVIREFMRAYVARHRSGKDAGRTAESGELPKPMGIHLNVTNERQGKDHAARISKSGRNIRKT